MKKHIIYTLASSIILSSIIFSASAQANDTPPASTKSTLCTKDALEYCYETAQTHAGVSQCMENLLKQAKTQFDLHIKDAKKNLKELNKESSKKIKNPDKRVQDVVDLFFRHQKSLCSLVKDSYGSGTGAGQGEQECYIQTYCEETKHIPA